MLLPPLDVRTTHSSPVAQHHRVGCQLAWQCRLAVCWLASLAACWGLSGCASAIVQPDRAENRLDAGLEALRGVVRGVRERASADPPSHQRQWRADLMVLPFAEIEDDRVILRNIRDCQYRTEDDYDVRHFDREIHLDDVRTIDFIVVPFKEAPALAHTMLSFGLSDGQHIVFSVEGRLEKGERYSALGGSLKQYELMWVVGTERDLIGLRTEVRDVDVYLYPTRATPEQVRTVFMAAIARVNEISRRPEYYDTLTNNCTTNIVDMLNTLRPGSIPKDIRVLLPGHSDRLAYDLGLLAAEGPFPMIKQSSRINTAARLHADQPDFSTAIRGQRPVKMR